MIKLGARDRAQLVVFAYQTGMVAPRAAGQAPGALTSLPLCRLVPAVTASGDHNREVCVRREVSGELDRPRGVG
jgi:hypothetical protein